MRIDWLSLVTWLGIIAWIGLIIWFLVEATNPPIDALISYSTTLQEK